MVASQPGLLRAIRASPENGSGIPLLWRRSWRPVSVCIVQTAQAALPLCGALDRKRGHSLWGKPHGAVCMKLSTRSMKIKHGTDPRFRVACGQYYTDRTAARVLDSFRLGLRASTWRPGGNVGGSARNDRVDHSRDVSGRGPSRVKKRKSCWNMVPLTPPPAPEPARSPSREVARPVS
jgi:hypothetical protein